MLPSARKLLKLGRWNRRFPRAPGYVLGFSLDLNRLAFNLLRVLH